ncbi:MAG TPA: 16S rRNA (uracil(1498)-N(3))-methyltransferase [Bacteroidales bacterium]|nr:16S rRNA (uracil(1498)-N(3))-methyltransferase [Bacteroidales bacterium]
MKLFYDPDISGDYHILNEEESKHCSKVLRLKNNEEVFITDGKGNLYKSVIAEITSKKTILKIVSTITDFEKRDYYLHIAIAPTKNNDRIEWFVEKATEIGVDEITPVICKNSERKIIKTDRLNRIAEAAMKQSLKAYHPKINEPLDFAMLLNQCEKYNQNFIAYCDEISDKQYLGKIIKPKSSSIILIGPEGDFNKEEIQMAKSTGFTIVSLGKSRLRTETAGVVACDIVSVVNQL